jgi:hypothetical protein
MSSKPCGQLLQPLLQVLQPVVQPGAAGTQQLAGAGAQYFGAQVGAQHVAGAGQQ